MRNAQKLIAAGVMGAVAAGLLAVSTAAFISKSAEATPALAKGKACTACHSSGKPSKSDLKKKK